jgi:hypothetical protein
MIGFHRIWSRIVGAESAWEPQCGITEGCSRTYAADARYRGHLPVTRFRG